MRAGEQLAVQYLAQQRLPSLAIGRMDQPFDEVEVRPQGMGDIRVALGQAGDALDVVDHLPTRAAQCHWHTQGAYAGLADALERSDRQLPLQVAATGLFGDLATDQLYLGKDPRQCMGGLNMHFGLGHRSHLPPQLTIPYKVSPEQAPLHLPSYQPVSAGR